MVQAMVRTQLTLVTAAMVWLAISSLQVRQPEARGTEFDRLRDKVERIEQGSTTSAVNLEARLVRLETNLDNVSKLLYGIGGAVSLQIIETAVGLFLKAKNRTQRP